MFNNLNLRTQYFFFKLGFYLPTKTITGFIYTNAFLTNLKKYHCYHFPKSTFYVDDSEIIIVEFIEDTEGVFEGRQRDVRHLIYCEEFDFLDTYGFSKTEIEETLKFMCEKILKIKIKEFLPHHPKRWEATKDSFKEMVD